MQVVFLNSNLNDINLFLMIILTRVSMQASPVLYREYEYGARYGKHDLLSLVDSMSSNRNFKASLKWHRLFTKAGKQYKVWNAQQLCWHRWQWHGSGTKLSWLRQNAFCVGYLEYFGAANRRVSDRNWSCTIDCQSSLRIQRVLTR